MARAGAARATAIRASTAHGAAGRYATTPASAGAVDPVAVPLGDGYVSSGPRVGYVDSCTTTFSGAGAQAEGPWIDAASHTWDPQAKAAVEGSVRWPGAYMRERVAHGKRVLSFDDLPLHDTTGTFPIASTDPAYRYDHNPNSIRAQAFRWRLPLHPRAARSPHCTSGGPIGVLDDGVVLYNALDAGGRDAVAHEVQDRCDGHPAGSGTYHHHDIPACILTRAPNGRATLVGYALDGYGIYVEKDARGDLPTNRGLDACHGRTSRVRFDGRETRVYHYVATTEYPYVVGCFHGKPIASGHGGRRAPGHAGGGQPGASGPPPGPGSGPPPGRGAPPG